MLDFDPQLLSLVILAFLVAFVLAFSIGANDVANSFGTSVGSKVLTIKQACILATIFEMLGAVLVGYKVSDTMRKGILDITVYEGQEKELIMGYLSSLIASAIWLLIATALKLPISGTHSIVGANVGFSLVLKGSQGIKWLMILKIAMSWFVSPVISGIISFGLFYLIKVTIINSRNPMRAGLLALPIAYGFTIGINTLSVLLDGPKLLKLDNLTWWMSLLCAAGIGLAAAIFVIIFVNPRQRRKLLADPEIEKESSGSRNDVEAPCDQEMNMKLSKGENNVAISTSTIESGIANSKNNSSSTIDQSENGDKDERTDDKKDGDIKDGKRDGNDKTDATDKHKKEQYNKNDERCEGGKDDATKTVLNEHPAVAKLFSFLQILTATFGSFAHGGNDVSNAIGPLIAIWIIAVEGSVMQTAETPFLILFYGGIGISVGLWCLGHRVIETVGQDLVEITPTSGFSIEIASAATVLVASKIGIPISTTHCKVGSVICVGWASSGKNQVSWHTFRNIAFAWLLTVPASGAISALCMWVMRLVFV